MAAAFALANAPAGAGASEPTAAAAAPAHTVRVALSYRRTGRGAVRLVSFSTNRLQVLDDGRGRIRARIGGRTIRLLRAPRRSRRWTRLSLRLDSRADRLSLRLGRRSVTRRLRLNGERRARAGRSRRSRHQIKSVRIRMLRDPAAPAPSPTPPRERAEPPAPAPPGAPAPPADPDAPERPFAPDSVWNSRLRSNAPLDPMSGEWVAELRRQLERAQPWINTTEYSTPVYTVPAGQPRVPVKLDTPWVPELEQAWAGVPIPPGAKPAAGSDKHMVIWQPSTDTMWEFWLAENRQDGWHARWGGRMLDVSRNPGHFTDPTDWGATATSLPLLGGLMRIDELKAGVVDHALAFAIPDTRAEWFTSPAQRTDGNIRSTTAIPEGAHFRLDPRLDLDSMQMDPIVRTMARAAQRYGMVLRDKSGAVSFYAEDPAPTGSNPYHHPGGLFGGKWINNLLREQFPWSRLQVLKTQQVCCWKR